jgi:hypothetical protein
MILAKIKVHRSMTDAEEGRFVASTIFEQKMQNPTVTALLLFYIVPMRNPVLWKMHLEKRYSVSHLWWFIFYQGKK